MQRELKLCKHSGLQTDERSYVDETILRNIGKTNTVHESREDPPM